MCWVESGRAFTSAASWECDAASCRQETPGVAGMIGILGRLKQGMQPECLQPAWEARKAK